MKTRTDLSKPVQTRDGCPARIVCHDALGCGDRPILALVTRVPGTEVNLRFHADGRVDLDPSADSDYDLVNVPDIVKAVLFVNVYPDGSTSSYSSVSSADAVAAGNRIACVRVDITVSPEGYSYNTKQI